MCVRLLASASASHHLNAGCLVAGILLPVVVPPIRERFYKPDVRNPPPFKQVRASPVALAAALPCQRNTRGLADSLSSVCRMLRCVARPQAKLSTALAAGGVGVASREVMTERVT